MLKFLEAARPDAVARVADAVDSLRDRGYPAPAYLCWGVFSDGTYVVQERLAGAPVGDKFGDRHVSEVLGLNQLQADASDVPASDWPLPVVRPILEGGSGFCLLETMQDHSDESRLLLGYVQEIARTDGPTIEPRTDFVHFDFSQANILTDGDRIICVIDWDAVCLGDRAFDLATLMFYADDNGETFRALRSAALDITTTPALRTYLAHMMLRQTEWSIRFHSPETAERYLDRSNTILSELG